MLRKRFLVPAIAALAMLAASIPAFAQEDADAPPPSHSAELRVWQSVSEPLNLWLSASPDGESGWVTRALNVAMREGGGWRVAERTVDALDGELEVRVWQHPGDLREIWVSARPAGGSWEEYGTKRVELDSRSRSGRYRYGDASVALAWPDDEPPLPGEDADALCIPDDMATDSVRTRVWRSVATPHRYWISAQADNDSRWVTRSVSLAATGEDGWRAGGRTVDAGDADFELRLWDGGRDGLYLSARVTGTTWHEYGTRPIDLNRTSSSGAYTYANRTVRLTLPEAEPPDPGEAARDWDCADSGTGGGTGEAVTLTANAGADQHIPPGTTTPVTLDGSGSTAPAGSTISYEWAQTSGDNVTLSGANTASASFTLPSGASVGDTFVFTLTVSDGEGGSDADTVTVTVNTPPSVDIAISISVTSQGAGSVSAQGNTPSVDCDAANVECARRGMTVNLTAMVNDPDGTMSYQWAKTGGTYTGAISITNATSASASFVMPKSARHGQTVIITLTVTDSYGATGTATVTITATNRVPYADAGDDQTASVGDTVTLDGSDSADVDEDTLTYSWAKTGGTYDGAVTLSDATAESPTFEVDAALAGLTAEFTLTVNDGHGGTNTDTVTVTVNQQQGGGGAPPGGGGPPTSPGGGQPTPNQAPTAHAGPDVTVLKGTTIRLDGSKSKDDDGSISEWDWDQTDGTTVTLTGADTANPSFTVPTSATAGDTFTFSLTVTDDDDADSTNTDTNTVTITVAADAINLSAGSDANAQRGQTATLSGTYTDQDTTSQAAYKWTKTGGTYTGNITINNSTTLTHATNANKANFTVPLDAGADATIILTLTVTDGGTTYVDTVTITAKNSAPTAHAGSNKNADRNKSTSLDGSGSADTNGDALTYSWVHTGGTYCPSPSTTPACKLENLSGETPSFTVPTGADHGETIEFTLTVTDTLNASSTNTDTNTVTITAQNNAPTVVSMVSGGNAARGSTVNLRATASDANSDTLTYSWAKKSGTLSISITDSDNSDGDASFRIPTTNVSIGDSAILTLTVDDGQSNGEITRDVTFTAANAPPTANAGLDVVTRSRGTVLLDGSGSSDTDGTISDTNGYSWSVSGTPAATLTGASTKTPTLTLPSANVGTTFTVTLTATDNNSGTGTDTMTVTVGSQVNAGSDQAVARGTTATLTGTYTDSNTSTTPTYKWTKESGPWTITLANSDKRVASFTVPTGSGAAIPSSILLRLTVTDDNKVFTDTVRVNATNVKPTVTITNFNVTAGNPATPTVASANDPDGDNTKITYSWSVSGLTATYASNDTVKAKPSFAVPSSASLNTTYSGTVTATDEDGGASTPASFTLTVHNRAPIARGSGTNYGQAGDIMYLLATNSSDPDSFDNPTSQHLTCKWAYDAGNSTYDGNTDPVPISYNTGPCTGPRFTVPSDATNGETLVFKLTVTDTKGGTDTTEGTDPAGQQPYSLVVGATAPPSNNAPTANAGPDLDFKLGTNNNKVTVTGSGSDPDSGDTLSYYWSTATSGPSSLLTVKSTATEPHKAEFTWPTSPVEVGIGTSVQLMLTVCDSRGACDDDYVIITRRHALTVDAGAEPGNVRRHSTANTTFTRTATVSNPDGFSSVTYDWDILRSGHNGLPYGVTITNRTTKTVTITFNTYAAAGTATNPVVYNISFTATGPNRHEAIDSMQLNLVANIAPTSASISGGNIPNARRNNTNTLTGSASDGNGDTLTYHWSAPANSGLSFSPNGTTAASTTTMSVASNAPLLIPRIVTLTVRDGYGGTDTATISVTVVN